MRHGLVQARVSEPHRIDLVRRCLGRLPAESVQLRRHVRGPSVKLHLLLRLFPHVHLQADLVKLVERLVTGAVEQLVREHIPLGALPVQLEVLQPRQRVVSQLLHHPVQSPDLPAVRVHVIVSAETDGVELHAAGSPRRLRSDRRVERVNLTAEPRHRVVK